MTMGFLLFCIIWTGIMAWLAWDIRKSFRRKTAYTDPSDGTWVDVYSDDVRRTLYAIAHPPKPNDALKHATERYKDFCGGSIDPQPTLSEHRERLGLCPFVRCNIPGEHVHEIRTVHEICGPVQNQPAPEEKGGGNFYVLKPSLHAVEIWKEDEL